MVEGFIFTPNSIFSPRVSLASRNRLTVDGKAVELSQLQPMSNFVLVKMSETSVSQTSGGIMLPEDKMAKWKPMEGTVISCGTGNARDREGRDVVGGPMPNIGDNVLFKNSEGAEVIASSLLIRTFLL